MQSISHQKFSWIFVEDIKAEDISFVQKEFNLHPLIIGKLTSPLYRPQFNEHDGYLFLVLHFPIFFKNGSFKEVGEIDILVNEKFVVTVCSKGDSPIEIFFNQCQRNIEFSKKYFQRGPYYLLLILISQILNSYFPFLDQLATKTDAIENDLFDNKESKTLKEITFLQRDILDARRILKPQLPVFKSIFSKEEVKKDNFLSVYAEDILSTNVQIWNTLENYWETANTLHRTNNTLLSHKLNKIVNILTAFSVSFLPVGILASIFGMNVKFSPVFEDARVIFFLMFLTMFMVGFFLFVLIKKKG